MTIPLVWLLPAAALLSAVLTGALRRVALARKILDVPNDRSSHTTPTPRGGGIAIVLAFFAGLAVLLTTGAVDVSLAIALAGSGALVATIGFLDDYRSRAATLRLTVHLAAAAWALLWLGGFPPIAIAGRIVDLGLAGNVLGAVGLVWLLNLYNFMDGIDAVAGIEAVTVGMGAAVLLSLQPAGGDHAFPPALLAMSALGFLWWNWPPGRIFMGDAGSGFLGLVLGIMAVRDGHLDPALLWAWAILLAVFITDATVTLLRRIARAAPMHEAHRSHAYQHAARRVGHGRVAVTVGAINVVWLFPLAWAAASGRLDGGIAATIAYAPLVWSVLRLDAGISEIIATTSENA